MKEEVCGQESGRLKATWTPTENQPKKLDGKLDSLSPIYIYLADQTS